MVKITKPGTYKVTVYACVSEECLGLGPEWVRFFLEQSFRAGVRAAVNETKEVEPTKDDLISRQDAIEAVQHAWAKGLEPSQYIDELPAMPRVRIREDFPNE